MKKQLFFIALCAGINTLFADIVRIKNNTPFNITVESISVPSGIGKVIQNIKAGDVIKASSTIDIFDLPEWEQNSKQLKEIIKIAGQKITLTQHRGARFPAKEIKNIVDVDFSGNRKWQFLPFPHPTYKRNYIDLENGRLHIATLHGNREPDSKDPNSRDWVAFEIETAGGSNPGIMEYIFTFRSK